MPKYKKSHKIVPSPADASPVECVHMKHGINIKIEPENDDNNDGFDSMLSESTKVILMNAVHRMAGADIAFQAEIDVTKLECDVDIMNPYRPEMTENSHEVAYMLRPYNKDVRVKIEMTTTKHKKKETKHTKKPKVDSVKIEVDGQNRAKIKNRIRKTYTRNASLSALRSHKESEHNKQKIQCEKCRLIFYEHKRLESHKLKCVANRSFECHLCSFKLDLIDMDTIKRHMLEAHTDDNAFNSVRPENILMKHRSRLPTQDVPFQCSKCLLKFQESKRCQTHKKKCRTQTRFECHVCRYTYPSMNFENLQSHMHKHTGFKCPVCYKLWLTKSALIYHVQRHREKFTLKCVRCCRAFANETELIEHKPICRKRRYECHLCGYTRYGLSYNSFKRHMYHHTGVRIIKCHGCSKSFGTHLSLAHHVAKSDHTQLLATICPNCCVRFSSRTDRDAHQSKCLRKRFECYLCAKTSRIPTSLESLKKHIAFKHTGSKSFSCTFCCRKFRREFHWKKHEKTHTKVGLIKCQYCAKTFIAMKYKKRHEDSCKMTYECYLCQKNFPSFTMLSENHMKTHIGRYQCKNCKKSSASPRTYALHVIGKHLNLYNIQCQSCNGIVKKRQDFRKHQNSCNKSAGRRARSVNYFKCLRCGMGLARMLQAKKHILSDECTNQPKAK